MPRLDPVPVDDLDPETRELIAAAQASRAMTSDLLPRIWSHHPSAAKAQLRLHIALHDERTLDARLAELVRLRIAALNECQACQTSRKSETVSDEDIACLASDDPRFTAREQAALRFAEMFALEHQAVSDNEIAALRRHFSPAEITELGMFVALMLGMGRLATVLDAYTPVKATADLNHQ